MVNTRRSGQPVASHVDNPDTLLRRSTPRANDHSTTMAQDNLPGALPPDPEPTGQPGPSSQHRQSTPSSDLASQLRIAELTLQIEQLRASNLALEHERSPQPTMSRGNTPSSTYYTSSFMDDVIDPDSPEGRQISAFRERVKLIRRPPTLQGIRDYPQWREAIELDAKRAGIEKLLESDEVPPNELPVWNTCNQWLYSHLLSHISSQALKQFVKPEKLTAKALWDTIHSTFAEKVDIIRSRLTLQLFTITPEKNNGGDRLYIERMLAIYTEISKLDKGKWTLPDHIPFDIVKSRLGRYWKEFLRMQIDQCSPSDSRPDENFPNTMRQLLARMPHTENQPQPNNNPNANAAPQESNNSRPPNNNRRSGQRGNSPTCNYCQGTTHTEEKCWFRRPDQASDRWRSANRERIEQLKHEKNTEPPPTTAYSCIPCNTTQQRSFSTSDILDSGAGGHISPHPVSNPVNRRHNRLIMANGQTSNIHSTGERSIPVDTGILHLENVRHVPAVTHNLISMGQLFRDGWDVRRINEPTRSYLFMESPDHKTSFKANLSNDSIFLIERQDPNPVSSVFAFSVREGRVSTINDGTDNGDIIRTNEHTSLPSVREDTMEVWHRRLGHISIDAIKTLARDPRLGIRIKGPKMLPFCPICHRAKQTTKSFKTAPRVTKPGMRLFIDIAGGGSTLDPDLSDSPVIPSTGGARYLMVVVDDATRYRWIFLLGTRTDVATVLPWFFQHLSNLGYAVAFVHTDGAPEFNSHSMQNTYRKHGIQHDTTVAYTSQQNGPAERAIRLACERFRAMLKDSNLPEHLWAEASVASISLLNNTPTSVKLYGCVSDPLTPYEAFFGYQPDYNWLVRWGSDAWLHTPTKSKLADRSHHMKLVGWEGHQIYRLWDPNTNKVYRARDIKFDEGFPQQVPINSVQQIASSECNILDPLAGWENRLISHLARHDPHSLDDLAAGRFATSDPDVFSLLTNELFEDETEDADTNPTTDLVISSHTDTPQSLPQARDSPDWPHWKAAMDAEVDKLQAMGTYLIVQKTKDMSVLTGKWVFARKLNNNGQTIRFKARWVVHGYKQQEGLHYTKTYAAVVNPVTTRCLFALAANRGYHSRSIDYVAAFLNGHMPNHEQLFIQLPTGRNHARGGPQMVGLLRQSLYGLKQSARIWYFENINYLKTLGFVVSPYDAGLLFHPAKHIYLTLHVDDSRIYAPLPQDVDWTVSEIQRRFQIKDVTADQRYLGMKVSRSDNGDIHISQEHYIDQLVTDFGLEDSNAPHTPMVTGIHLDFSPAAEDEPDLDHGFSHTNYQVGTGRLQFLTGQTRPDISFPTNYLSRFNSFPSQAAWRALKRVIRYLKGTKSLGILYRATNTPTVLAAYSDSDWAGADPGFKSTAGYVIYLHGSPVSWRAHRQVSISKSTTEAEYYSASEAASELVWIRDLLTHANLLPPSDDYLQGPAPPLFIDNRGATDLAKTDSIPRRSRHIEVRFHFLRDLIDKRAITISSIPSTDNKADGFTKPLSYDAFNTFRTNLSLT